MKNEQIAGHDPSTSRLYQSNPLEADKLGRLVLALVVPTG